VVGVVREKTASGNAQAKQALEVDRCSLDDENHELPIQATTPPARLAPPAAA
jgi:hypothetical protein